MATMQPREKGSLIGPEHTFHWLHRCSTSCSLVGKYGWKAVERMQFGLGFDNVMWRELLVSLNEKAVFEYIKTKTHLYLLPALTALVKSSVKNQVKSWILHRLNFGMIQQQPCKMGVNDFQLTWPADWTPLKGLKRTIKILNLKNGPFLLFSGYLQCKLNKKNFVLSMLCNFALYLSRYLIRESE